MTAGRSPRAPLVQTGGRAGPAIVPRRRPLRGLGGSGGTGQAAASAEGAAIRAKGESPTGLERQPDGPRGSLSVALGRQALMSVRRAAASGGEGSVRVQAKIRDSAASRETTKSRRAILAKMTRPADPRAWGAKTAAVHGPRPVRLDANAAAALVARTLIAEPSYFSLTPTKDCGKKMALRGKDRGSPGQWDQSARFPT